MTLTLSSHTPAIWRHSQAIDALIKAADKWPGYTFHVTRKSASTVLIFVRDTRNQPIGWLGSKA